MMFAFMFGLIDIISMPIYWLFKQFTCSSKSRVNHQPARTMLYKADNRRMKYRLTDKVSDDVRFATMDQVLTNFFATYSQRPCLGFRRKLGTVMGQHEGKPVEKTLQDRDFQVMTYAEVEAKVVGLATGLVSTYNLTPGDRVMIFASTSSQWMVGAMGCVRAGLVIATLAPSSNNQALELALDQIQPKVIVLDPKLLQRTTMAAKKVGLMAALVLTVGSPDVRNTLSLDDLALSPELGQSKQK